MLRVYYNKLKIKFSLAAHQGVSKKAVLKICSKFSGEHTCWSAKQLYCNYMSAWVFSCKFAAYFWKHLWWAAFEFSISIAKLFKITAKLNIVLAKLKSFSSYILHVSFTEKCSWFLRNAFRGVSKTKMECSMLYFRCLWNSWICPWLFSEQLGTVILDIDT